MSISLLSITNQTIHDVLKTIPISNIRIQYIEKVPHRMQGTRRCYILNLT